MHYLTGHTAAILTVALSADGQRIVTAGGDGTARVWTIQGRQEFVVSGHVEVRLDGTRPYPVESASFSPDGKLVLTNDGGGAYLWSAFDGRPVLDLAGFSRAGFSADGQFITLNGATYRLLTFRDLAATIGNGEALMQ